MNNLFVATDAARYGYSIGIGKRCRIVSEDNAWEAPGVEDSRLLRASDVAALLRARTGAGPRDP